MKEALFIVEWVAELCAGICAGVTLSTSSPIWRGLGVSGVFLCSHISMGIWAFRRESDFRSEKS